MVVQNTKDLEKGAEIEVKKQRNEEKGAQKSDIGNNIY
jgi:hypothetical protein